MMSLELPPGFPSELQPLAREIHTYFRELPRLLAEGEEGRTVVIQGDTLFGVWDTQRDAIQAGHERFGHTRFLAQKVERRLLDALGTFFRVTTESPNRTY
jgi:hypothetical protein